MTYHGNVWEDDLGIWVELTMQEMLHGANVGVIRQYESIKSNRKPAHGFDPEKTSALSVNIDGAMGEIAVAKLLGLYYDGTINTFKAADVGEKIQVRTATPHNYNLLIRPDDNPDHVFYLVTGTAPKVCIRGWIVARDGMQNRFWRNPGDREPLWIVWRKILTRPVMPKHLRDI